MNTITRAEAPLSLRRLQDHTLSTARYLDKHDPHEILRRGFIEEVHELCVELEGDDVSKISGETGDLLWYAAEFSRHMPEDLYGIESSISLDVLHNMAGPSTDLEDVVRLRIGAEDISQSDILTIAAFRVIDSMQPSDDTLWLPPRGRINSGLALNQFLFVLGNIAQERGVTLSGSAYQTLAKLRTRTRNTNVLERVDNPESEDDNYAELLQLRMAKRAMQATMTPDTQAS